MPSVSNGTYGADETLVRALTELFNSWEGNHPVDPKRAAKEIAVAFDRERLFREIHEAQAEALTGERRYSAGDYNKRVDEYLGAMKAARKAWLNLPSDAQELMPQSFWQCKTSLLNPSLLQALATVQIMEQSHKLADWRASGLRDHQTWGADIEIIDLLLYAVQTFKEQHSPAKSSRDRWEPEAIRAVSKVCETHGITVAAATGGHFTAIVQLLFPGRDARDLIRQALRQGKYSRN